jgi:quercetin dioxygenase-like cupin family protein
MSTFKEVITLGGLEVRFLLDGDDTDNQMVVFELLIQPGAKVPKAHFHVDVDEMLYGMEGVTTSYVDGERTDIAPGQSLFIRRGQVHYHDNLTDQVAKTLCVLTPASIGPAYFRELRELLKAGGPPDQQKLTEIMLRHGLVASV